MTDITIKDGVGFHIVNGVCPLLSTKSDLIRQQMYITLNTFTGTWYDDLEFGVPSNLMFKKSNKDRLDAAYKKLITDIDGVISLTKYNSVLSKDRILKIDFECSVEDGTLISDTIYIEV